MVTQVTGSRRPCPQGEAVLPQCSAYMLRAQARQRARRLRCRGPCTGCARTLLRPPRSCQPYAAWELLTSELGKGALRSHQAAQSQQCCWPCGCRSWRVCCFQSSLLLAERPSVRVARRLVEEGSGKVVPVLVGCSSSCEAGKGRGSVLRSCLGTVDMTHAHYIRCELAA